jgi:hypothetical protein
VVPPFTDEAVLGVCPWLVLTVPWLLLGVELFEGGLEVGGVPEPQAAIRRISIPSRRETKKREQRVRFIRFSFSNSISVVIT